MDHVPVLADEALQWLDPQPDGVYVDATAGAGGHARRIAERLGPAGRLIAIDCDPAAIEMVRERLRGFGHVTVVQGNYGELPAHLDTLGIGNVDGVLIDAGISSVQLDAPERGFSFQAEGGLDMRMNPAEGLPANAFLAGSSDREIFAFLREYGDVRPARRLARAIGRAARAGELRTTTDLVRCVQDALGVHHRVPEEARTVFQAIRIAVNNEFAHLRGGVEQAIDRLRPGGRFVGIAFHSGEDRIIKDVLRRASRPGERRRPDGRVIERTPPRVRLLTRKPVHAGPDEVARNPRAQSACLRAAERLGAEEE